MISRFAASFVALQSLLVAVSIAPAAHAQTWPSKPIRFVVGNPPGGTTDLMARVIADKLKEKFNQPVVIETRAGAASLLALEYVAKQPADGYSFVVASSSISTLYVLNKNATYDPNRDFVPVAGIAIAPFLVMVRADFPAKDLREFITYVRANPGKVNVAAAGSGSFDHLAGTKFALATDTKMTWIAHKGEAAAVPELVAGRADASFLQWGLSGPHILSGRIRVLGSMSATRHPSLPNILTAAELGTKVEAAAWFALFGPSGMPKDIVERMNRESNEILRSPDGVAKIRGIYQEPMVMTTTELGRLVRSSTADWTKVIKAANLTVE